MEFAPRELCEKLVKMGCESESGKFWSWKGWKERPENSETLDDFANPAYSTCPAFCQNDFTGATKQAKDNARFVWGEEAITVGPAASHYQYPYNADQVPAYAFHRFKMIDCLWLPELWWQYLNRTMKKHEISDDQRRSPLRFGRVR